MSEPTLIERLRRACGGHTEWLVQDPETGAFCMSFNHRDSINPEREAREWLANRKRQFPHSDHDHYVVACVQVMTMADKLMAEAADEIERLLKVGPC